MSPINFERRLFTAMLLVENMEVELRNTAAHSEDSEEYLTKVAELYGAAEAALDRLAALTRTAHETGYPLASDPAVRVFLSRAAQS